jgi:hypothetical protein
MATPTTTVNITLHAHYSDRTATVRAQRWPNGDCWITARQMRSATSRAGVIQGDYLEHCGGDSREGYLVATDR